MRLVVIESPYAGDVDRNVAYALRCVRWSLDHGEAPIAGHLLYTRVWDDADPQQRAAGIAAHCAWISRADRLVVYCDYGVSAGMRQGIDTAMEYGTPIVERSIGVLGADLVLSEGLL